ncbi:MAG: DUF5317 family protein [Bacillota bacterium]|nr:DUF5317 family protein [Bacillota bacterium]
MIETILLSMLAAKLKRYKLSPLFKAWPIYFIISFEVIYIVLQVELFKGNYSVLKYTGNMEKPFLCLFLILALKYRQYISAIIGSGCILTGGFLNDIVISANNGKMPVFPTLSYLTGYADTWVSGNLKDIHTLGTASTDLKFLSDIFDLGYCIMSVGDIFIRLFVFIITFSIIKQINQEIGCTVIVDKENNPS